LFIGFIMLTKVCTKCLVEKSVDCFNKKTKGVHGVKAHCRSCDAAYNSVLYSNNRGEIRKAQQEYYLSNKEKRLNQFHEYYLNHVDEKSLYNKNYGLKNQEQIKQVSIKWRKQNAHRLNASVAKRNATKLQATPSWSNTKDIEMFYEQATELTELGFPTHVDHIVPLQSKLVCGLHCEANLQLLSASDNSSKGNRWWPDMW
jgi:hypothetical protein